MKIHLAAAAAIPLFLSMLPAWGSDSEGALPSGFATEPVLKSGMTADGDQLVLPGGTPEIVSVIGTIEPGGRTARHQHPVPVYVYVLDGALEVQTEGRDVRHYGAGEAFLESIDRWHQAFNNGSVPTRILVVFIGEEGKPTTIASR